MNDFRHYLKLAHASKNNITNDNDDGEQQQGISTNIPHHRYIASLVAIRLGLRDALVDVAILYSLTYTIVAAFTWNDADPNSLYVIWGISAMVSASILGIGGLKVPQWVGSTAHSCLWRSISDVILTQYHSPLHFSTFQLGIYRKSNLQILKDTSGRAPQAVNELTYEGSSLTAFRYQVRLGVGKHTTQFIFFLLPFYTDLKVWSFFVSFLVGFLFGHLYLYIVFKFRKRFVNHRGRVAMGASVALSIISALVFVYGMDIIESVWVSILLVCVCRYES